MKARKRTSRWLLLALLFGILAATGLTLAHRHALRALAKGNDAAAPMHIVLQMPTPALVASVGGKHLLDAPAGAHRHWTADSTPPNTQAPEAGSHPGSRPNTSTAGGSGWSNAAQPVGDSSVGSQPQGNRPPAANTDRPPRNGANDFAYNGYVPLDCELPAGCGVGVTGYGSHPISGPSAGLPSVHNSQGSGSGGDDPVPQTDGGGPQTHDTGQVTDPPGQSPDPPAPKPLVAAAPELDPATLAGAITLLLGSLAVLRGRRARARC